MPDNALNLPDGPFSGWDGDDAPNRDDLSISEDAFPAFVDDEPEPAPARRLPIGAEHQPQPPNPTEQSGFVNPAMARVAAHRPNPVVREPNEAWLGIRTVTIVTVAALVAAFILSYWTPDSFLSDEFVAELQLAVSTQGPPTPIPSPIPTYSAIKKVGVIAGHSGPPLDTQFEVDPGAVCDDNFDGIPELTELEINVAVAQRVTDGLIAEGYQVELLQEYDPRLPGYRADVLISIHTNTCQNYGVGQGATGYNVEGNTTNPTNLERETRLQECIAGTYAEETGLPRHYGRPPDLVDYHVFNKVSPDTPTAIVELGFMLEDRPTLLQRQEDIARGVVRGINCFLDPASTNPPQTGS
jgi:N-acetylmuramoyl-L-alanine amidase